MRIKESAENYLEAILILKKEKGNVRSIDIANDLGVTKPSVSVAMKSFREEGYITVDENGSIELTEKGMEIANRVYERHEIIAKALMAIGVSKETAYEDSCKIEHDISNETFKKLKTFLKKTKPTD
ncbi:MAG: metal-dependent transcriptional regulator [Clostridia bacterium]|nr:metal-dependent transcriptional regulator [Clostridia bacterium]